MFPQPNLDLNAEPGRSSPFLLVKRLWNTGESNRSWLLLLIVVVLGYLETPAAVYAQATASQEQAARQEYMAIERALDSGSRIPPARYEAIIKKYPTTAAAYEARIDLVRMDYQSIQTQLKTSRTKTPAQNSARKVLDQFAFGEFRTPPTRELQLRYETDMYPVFFELVKLIGTWQVALDYLEAYPRSDHADGIRSSIEAAIANPGAGWEAVDIVNRYAEIDPLRVRDQHFKADVETGLLSRLNLNSSIETLQRFLTAYPDSIYAADVETLIDQKLGAEPTVYLGRVGLERFIEKNPGTLNASRAQSALDDLQAQEDIFNAAMAEGTIEALETFLQENPRSRFLTPAALEIESRKLAALSSSERAQLQTYKNAYLSMSSSPSASGTESALQAANRELNEVQQRIRNTRKRKNDLEAKVREEKRLRNHATKVRNQIRNKIKRVPDLKPDLQKRNKEIADRSAEIKRLNGEAAKAKQALEEANLQDTLITEKILELKREAGTEKLNTIAEKNRARHQYLARLEEAWRRTR